jgi:hypothetical protein
VLLTERGHRCLRRLHGAGAGGILSVSDAVLLVAHLLEGAPAQGSSGAAVVKSLAAGAQMTEAPASSVAEQGPSKGAGATALKQLLPPRPPPTRTPTTLPSAHLSVPLLRQPLRAAPRTPPQREDGACFAVQV